MCAAVELVCAGLDLHIHCGAASHALLGIERVRRYVHRLDRIRRRHIGNVRREPWIRILSTINSSVDSLIGLSIDIGIDRSLRVTGKRVRLRRQSHSRYCPQEPLKIPALGTHVR